MSQETNEEFIVRVMNFGCPTGALIQPFIIEALRQYAERVIASEMQDSPMVSAAAWKETATFLKGELNKKYGG